MNRTIRKLLDNGVQQKEIALLLGLSPANISRRAIRMGYRRRSRRLKHDWVAIAAYYDAGHTLSECKVRFGISNGAIDAAIARGDLVTRSHTPRKPGITRKAVEVLLSGGLSQAEVARQLGISEATVSHHAKHLGVQRKSMCARRYDWQEIQAYYDLGHSIRECQERFGFARKSAVDAAKRGDFVTRPQAAPIDEVFAIGQKRNRGHLKKRLFRAGLKEELCEICGLAEWIGKPLSLELHHINGDGLDNRLSNLQLLCGNCHSQTDTWGGRNARRKAA